MVDWRTAVRVPAAVHRRRREDRSGATEAIEDGVHRGGEARRAEAHEPGPRPRVVDGRT